MGESCRGVDAELGVKKRVTAIMMNIIATRQVMATSECRGTTER